ncbi:MAG: alpha-L-fucosidase [Verrucomicrobiia bacterium]
MAKYFLRLTCIKITILLSILTVFYERIYADNAALSQTNTIPRPYPERLKWWSDARFGIFIHYGPVSITGKEISWSRANTNPKCPNKGPIPANEYDNLYKIFNPKNFNAEQWIGLIKASGAKYFVLTAKHCDGFLLWHSKVSDYNISNTPFGRDICGELAKAARANGIRVGWYFSPMDWRDPDFRTERNNLFIKRMQGELQELLSYYGRVDLLWFDWDGGEPLYDQSKTYSLVKQLQPEIIINNRLDLSPTNNDRQILSSYADYYTPEQHIGSYDDQTPWESCMTTSLRGQWAWGGFDDGVKSYETCLNMLIRCAGGDGNLLLNIGPMPNGEIDYDQANLLRKIGEWLSVYGESIYGTRGGPFKPAQYGVSTRKGNTIFIHILDWTDDTIVLPPIPGKIVNSYLLGGGNVRVLQHTNKIEITVRKKYRKPIDTIVAIVLDRPAIEIPSINVPEPISLAVYARATASNTYNNDPKYSPDMAVDNNENTRWATDSGTKSAWLEIDLGKPTTFSRVIFKQAYPELKRIRKYNIEYWKNNKWRVCYEGKAAAEIESVRFKPVTAQRVRLNILESTDGPTIKEFKLFR